jgi:hypothetical protein
MVSPCGGYKKKNPKSTCLPVYDQKRGGRDIRNESEKLRDSEWLNHERKQRMKK